MATVGEELRSRYSMRATAPSTSVRSRQRSLTNGTGERRSASPTGFRMIQKTMAIGSSTIESTICAVGMSMP